MSRYDRQTCLHDVGEAGQKRLGLSKVLVVGAGGLGSPVVQYLAGAGIGHVDVLDPDVIEETNLHRQVLYTNSELGFAKARVASERARAVGVKSNWAKCAWGDPKLNGFILKKYGVILDCTDRWGSHDAVIQDSRRDGVIVVHGSIQGLLGRVMVFEPGGPCWRCLHPSKPENKDAVRGTLGPVCGVVGSLMAFEAIRLLLGWGSSLTGRMLTYDARAARTSMYKRTQRPDCTEH